MGGEGSWTWYNYLRYLATATKKDAELSWWGEGLIVVCARFFFIGGRGWGSSSFLVEGR